VAVIDLEVYPRTSDPAGNASPLMVKYRVMSTATGFDWKVETEGSTQIGGKIASVDTLAKNFIVQFWMGREGAVKMAWESIPAAGWQVQNGDRMQFTIVHQSPGLGPPYEKWEGQVHTLRGEREGPGYFTRRDEAIVVGPGFGAAGGFNLGFPTLKLPTLPNPFEGAKDLLMWAVVGVVALIIIILVVMRS
jgi:hypothetical protein